MIAWCASPTYAGQLPLISSTTESRGATQLSLLIHQQHQRIYPYLNPIPEGRVSVYNDKYNKNRRPASFYVRSSPQLGPFFGIFTHVYNEDEPCPSECLKENNHTAIPWGQKITGKIGLNRINQVDFQHDIGFLFEYDRLLIKSYGTNLYGRD